MQTKASAYLAKRIGDELLKPSKPTEPAEPDEPEPPADELEGQVFLDEHERSLGTSYRLPGVAVYVVTDGYANREEELARCLPEPQPRIFLRREDGRITGLIYVPDPSRAPRRPDGMRASEV